MKKYTTINDFKRYVSEVVGDFEDQQDAIVSAVADEFWHIAKELQLEDSQEVFTLEDVYRIQEEINT